MKKQSSKSMEELRKGKGNGNKNLFSPQNTNYQFKDNRADTDKNNYLQNIIYSSPKVTQMKKHQELAGKFEPENNSIQKMEKQDQVDEPIQKQENKTGMPDNLKTGIENLSGIDMSDVKVNYNSAKPAQLNAYAYTQGTDIHISPGQEKHLAHEAWHAVQQKQGRVSPTTQLKKGIHINDNAELEKEADIMGQKSLNATNTVQRKKNDNSIEQGNPNGGVIQRSIGLEIESDSSWQAYKLDKELLVGTHTVIYQTPQFRLETELSGRLEFVIEPPVNDTRELIPIVQQIQEVVKALLQADTTREVGYDPFSLDYMMKKYQKSKEEILATSAFSKYVNKNIHAIHLKEVFPDGPALLISKGQASFPGGFQATVGVNLSAVPDLFKWIKSGFRTFPKRDQMANAQMAVNESREMSIGQDINLYNQISPQMEGLLHLIYYYINVGLVTERHAFPKGLTQIMAKTNFAHMFSMTPESAYLASNPDLWVTLITKSVKVNPHDKIFRCDFGDTAQDSKSVDLTYSEWLTGMLGTIQKPGIDKLSVAGGGPDILKTMGSLNKSDNLGAPSHNDRGAIIELRGFESNTKPYTEWHNYAAEISNGIECLNQRNILPKARVFTDVMSAGQAGQFTGSLYSADQKALTNVTALALEATRSYFKSQVQALISKARTQAMATLGARARGDVL